MPTDYRSLYGKEWVGAYDLHDGKDTIVTITAVTGGELTSVGGRKSKKPVLSIKGTAKKLAINVTNGRTIATMYGKHIEGWIGKKIALYKAVTRDPNDGGETECIRVRPQIPAAKPQAQEDAATPLSPPTDAATAGLGEGG